MQEAHDAAGSNAKPPPDQAPVALRESGRLLAERAATRSCFFAPRNRPAGDPCRDTTEVRLNAVGQAAKSLGKKKHGVLAWQAITIDVVINTPAMTATAQFIMLYDQRQGAFLRKSNIYFFRVKG